MGSPRRGSNQERRNTDYLYSSFTVYWCQTSFVYKSECVFAFVILFCGFIELVVNESYIIFLFMLLASFTFILLFFEFYFGSVYNCAALLHLHTFSAAFIALCCWLGVLIPLLNSEILYIASRSVAHEIYKYYGCQIIFGSLLVSFSAASYSRYKELKAVELSHVDYLKRLMRLTSTVAADVHKEARSFHLKLRDIHSFT